MSHFAQSQLQHVNPSPFKTPSKKDNRQQVFTEEGVSMVVDHELHYKNSDDEGDHDDSGSRSDDDRRRKSMTTLSHLSNKDEHNDDHGRQVSHRHPQHHTHHVVGSPATSHKQLAHSTSSHNHLQLHHAHSSTDHHSHHHSGSGHNHHHHNNHEKLSSLNSINGFWMLIDGIGLAIITAATILEGYELWIHFFHKYWEVNTTSLILWFLGRTFQIIGLLFLIGHASSFQVFHEIEQFGMLMLTIGPMVNMAACYTFALASDPDHLFQKQWFSTETMELVGILILDVSLIDMEEIHVLTAELVGFVCLCCAAGLTMEFQPVFHPLPSIPASYTKIVAQTAVTAATTALHRMLPQHGSGDSSSSSIGGSAHAGDLSDLLQSADAPVFALNHRPSSVLSSNLPDGGSLDALTASTGDWSTWWTWWVPHQVTWRLDTVHMSECCGLILLMCVAYGQYRMKLHKHQLLHATDPPAAHTASQSSYSSKDASAAVASIAVALNV